MEILAQYIILALAVYRISRLIIEDTIFEKIREKIFSKFSPGTFLGYLLTCYWCISMWVATPLVVGYILEPSICIFICLPFALSAVAGILSEKN
jgi:hypothetical protein